jgi:hypothetical protein
MDARDLEPRNMSVYRFCEEARELLDDDHASFVRFVLTGRHDETQAVVDPILNSIPENEPIGVTRDYDSLLGIDKDIRLTCPLTVYPVSKKEDVLSKSIHIRFNFRNRKVFSSLTTAAMSNIFS